MLRLYCENCHYAFEGHQCPVCGNKNVREPLPNDPCFLCEKQVIWGEMLAEALKNDGISVILMKRLGMGMALQIGPIAEHYRIYVPFSRLQDSLEICEEMFSSDYSLL